MTLAGQAFDRTDFPVLRRPDRRFQRFGRRLISHLGFFAVDLEQLAVEDPRHRLKFRQEIPIFFRLEILDQPFPFADQPQRDRRSGNRCRVSARPGSPGGS